MLIKIYISNQASTGKLVPHSFAQPHVLTLARVWFVSLALSIAAYNFFEPAVLTSISALVTFPHPSGLLFVRVLNVMSALPVLFACDHASPHIPDELNKLGVVEEHLHDHIAWDIGAADVALELGRLLEAPVVLATHSRLVVDCNRNLDDPTAFPGV